MSVCVKNDFCYIILYSLEAAGIIIIVHAVHTYSICVKNAFSSSAQLCSGF